MRPRTQRVNARSVARCVALNGDLAAAVEDILTHPSTVLVFDVPTPRWPKPQACLCTSATGAVTLHVSLEIGHRDAANRFVFHGNLLVRALIEAVPELSDAARKLNLHPDYKKED